MIHLKNFNNFSVISEGISVERIPKVAYENETVLALPYSNLIEDNRQSFLKKLVRVSKDLGIKTLWLLHVIFNESKFDPRNKNKITRGVGLLSFLPQVISSFIDLETGKNYTTNDVLEMSNLQQLNLVKSFYQAWIQKMKLKSPIIPGDFAALTFYPDVIKKDWSWEFPDYVIVKNPDLFNGFSTEGKTKKDYYNYIEKIFNNNTEYLDSDLKFLGNFSGAMVDPSINLSKNPLEFYKELLMSIEDPSLNQKLDNEETKETEKNKQIDK
jgi:hypothetical protein